MSDPFSLVRALAPHYSRSTSESPHLWTPQRPSTGHCAIVSVLLQARFGGSLVRGVSSGGIVHYWNEIDDITFDATRDQFPGGESFTGIVYDPSPDLYAHQEMLAKMALLCLRAGAF